MAPLGAAPRGPGSGRRPSAMLDLAGVGEGSRVLDVAAGAGGQTLAAARRVGARGAVLATDISPKHPRVRRSRGAPCGARERVAVHTADGEELDVDAGSFDAAISRLGLIYFPDQRGRARRYPR